MKLLPLVDLKAYYATCAVHKLMFGLKMQPGFLHMGYREFFEDLDKMTDVEKDSMVRQALIFVRLDDKEENDEVLDLIQFVEDPNGIAYGREQLKALAPDQIHEILVFVVNEILKCHKIRLINDTQKKNLKVAP